LAVRLCIIPGSAYSALCGAPHNAEFERALIRERQREGIALAKRRGAYRGRKKSLSPEKASALKQRVAAGEKKAALAREFGISRETLYQYLRDRATIPERSDV
jgi:DNA invertase Pin-like site-specific DNA recombinase